jgi:hypothetical protein
MGLLEESFAFQQRVILNLFGFQYYRAHSQPAAMEGTEWFWVIGVLVTLFGATLTVVGLMIQKQSHSSSNKSPESFGRQGAPATPYYLEARWLFGGFTWLMGNLVCWVALGLAPQTILAAINCWNIIVTLAVAPWFLGEPVSKRTVISALILAFGTGWVVACGPKAYKQHTVALILEAFGKPQSILAFGTTVTFLVTMAVLAYNRARSRTAQTLVYFQFTAVSACFAWYATLLSKSTAKVMVASVQLHQHLYLNPVFWLLAALFPVCALCQIHFLNMGLKHGEAVVVIPMYEALSMTGQIVVGGLVFDEFGSLDARQHAWFWPGVAIVLAGIASIALEARQGAQASHKSIDERLPLLEEAAESKKM